MSTTALPSRAPTPPAATPAPRAPRTPRTWWLAAGLAGLVSAYAVRHLVLGPRAYVPELAASFHARPWAIGAHVLFGPIALTVGLAQLLPVLQQPRWRALHRVAGRLYGASAVALATAGLYLAAYSAGGAVTHGGFGLLALCVLATTWQGYRAIRRGDVGRHRAWMLRSYALVFGAVTLRLWLPLLIAAHQGDFLAAYRWVAWLSWVPNLLWAEWRIRRGRQAAPRLRGTDRRVPAGDGPGATAGCA
jgi:uncharacterized membrane protein